MMAAGDGGWTGQRRCLFKVGGWNLGKARGEILNRGNIGKVSAAPPASPEAPRSVSLPVARPAQRLECEFRVAWRLGAPFTTKAEIPMSSSLTFPPITALSDLPFKANPLGS
ncbi:hypothetical protein V6N12_029695 [Hibiscus sabdariffa]|uniref:Uncharacterized protein n=1 Tax=Hibiscus sabdariffa TaxID=183260 RepID=A0ABR2CWV8_9ROSI